jgi:restriction system protein
MAKITKERIGSYLQTAFNVLQENGGQLPSRTVMRLVESKLQLTDYEKERLEKSGRIRWETPFAFYSMGCTKTGWLIKRKGILYITPEGVDALKYSPAQLRGLRPQPNLAVENGVKGVNH